MAKTQLATGFFAMTLKKSCETVPFKSRDSENFMIIEFSLVLYVCTDLIHKTQKNGFVNFIEVYWISIARSTSFVLFNSNSIVRHVF